jgi:membrane-bound lytic murein transglycosylase D
VNPFRLASEGEVLPRAFPRRARHFLILSIPLLALTLALTACNDSAKQTTRVKAPAPVPTAPAPQQAEQFPFPDATTVADEAAYPLIDRRSQRDILLIKMNAYFEAGQKAFDAQDLDKARQNFNDAISAVLSTGIEVDADPEVSALFDKILDTLHADALEDAQTAETENTEGGLSEPAPIDEIPDMTTLPRGDPRLSLKAEQEIMKVPHDLPLAVNDSVMQYLNFFQTDHGRLIVETGLRRAGAYRDMIRQVLKQEGLPQDLIYLAQAESAFQPQAVSRAGARGIWQFMPFRGEEYDLTRSWWIDERSDPEKATHAAAHHLRDLYGMFGDWYLVMAAYNSGPGNVARAIEHTGYADFWELQRRNALPAQTRNYVPIILALALVAKDPALYGVQVTPDAPPKIDLVKPGHPVDLRLVADATGTELDDLRTLNPQLLRLVTPDDSTFILKLPVGTADRFKSGLAQIPSDKWTSWRLHQVGQGENLSEIAKHYRVTAASIRESNHMSAGDEIAVGDALTIPASAPRALHLVHYKVRRGDTLTGIAEQFSVTTSDIRRWNHIRGNAVPRGSHLRIYEGGDPSTTPHAAADRPSHGKTKTVAESDPDEDATIPATRAKATHSPKQPESKSAANEAAPSPKSASKPASKSPSKSQEARSEAANSAAKSAQHKVKPGETLYSIARQYGTSVDALRDANPELKHRSLEAGDTLNVTAQR